MVAWLFVFAFVGCFVFVFIVLAGCLLYFCFLVVGYLSVYGVCVCLFCGFPF